MAQQLILSSDKKRVAVAPGAKTEFTVNIQNLTTLLDDVTVTVSGLDPAWVQVVPAHVPVFAQGEASVRVILQPPLDPARALCGVYPLQVSGQSQESGGQQAQTALDLEIQFGGDYRIEIGVGTSSGQEAAFPIKVRNEANAPLTLRCAGQDAANAFWYKFEPFQLNVPAGGEASAALTVRARQPSSDGQQVNFTLNAQGEWSAPGLGTISAPAHAVEGQWGQAAAASLQVAIEPYRADGSARSAYRVTVRNPGGQAEAAGLEFSSAERSLGFQFNPAQVSLAPQGQAAADLLVWLTAQAAGPAFDFWVTARPLNPRTRPGSAKAVFYPPAPEVKKRPNWLIPVIVAGVLLLLACIAVVIGLYVLRSQGG